MSYMYTMYLDHVCLLPPPGNSTWPPRNTTSPQFQVPSLFFNNPLNPMSSAYVWASSLPVVTYNPKTRLPQNLLTTRIPQVGMGQQEPSLLHGRLTDLTLFRSSFPQTGTNQPSQCSHSLLPPNGPTPVLLLDFNLLSYLSLISLIMAPLVSFSLSLDSDQL